MLELKIYQKKLEISTSLSEYTNLFSPTDYEKNGKIYIFTMESKYIKMYCNVCNKYGKSQKS